jgi:hypothetical protein
MDKDKGTIPSKSLCWLEVHREQVYPLVNLSWTGQRASEMVMVCAKARLMAIVEAGTAGTNQTKRAARIQQYLVLAWTGMLKLELLNAQSLVRLGGNWRLWVVGAGDLSGQPTIAPAAIDSLRGHH